MSHSAVTGSSTGSVTISNLEEGSIVVSHKEGKEITSVSFHDVGHHPRPELVFTASADRTVKAHEVEASRRGASKLKTLWTMDRHKDVVTSFSLHATGDYYVSSSLDGSWMFGDVESGRVLTHVAVDDESGRFQFWRVGDMFVNS